MQSSGILIRMTSAAGGVAALVSAEGLRLGLRRCIFAVSDYPCLSSFFTVKLPGGAWFPCKYFGKPLAFWLGRKTAFIHQVCSPSKGCGMTLQTSYD